MSPLIWAWIEAAFPLYVQHLKKLMEICHLPVSRHAYVCLYKFIQEKSEALTLKTSVIVIILPYCYARDMFSLLRENSVVFFAWILLMVKHCSCFVFLCVLCF